jgi:SAM-dependent methyltransferase
MIERKDGTLSCKKCGQIIKINHGIVDFSDRNIYWNQISQLDMVKLLDVCQNKGWREALRSIFLKKTDKYHFDYAMDEKRGDFSLYLDIKENTRVLDLGCGWGAVTLSIARKSANVFGADATLETLRFLKLRAAQEGLNNLNLVRLNPFDFHPFPFKDNFFEIVILNGVLEWIGNYKMDLKPDKLQLNALKEVQRIMKPGGSLYIGIENRWGFGMFLGGKDHSGKAYTSIMPRFLANVYTKTTMNKPYRTYTYSHIGYSKLLKKAGFKNVEFFMPMESYRFPDFMIPLNNKKIFEYFLENFTNTWKKKFMRRTVSKMLISLNLHKMFICNNYSIFAKK